MKKKIITVIYIIALLLVLFALQIFVIDSKTLFGIKPNLILISSIAISIWYGEKVGGIYSFILGAIVEFLFNSNGMFLVAYTVVGILVGILNTKYNKENKLSIVYVTIIATFLFEFIQYIYYCAMYNVYSNLFYFIKQVVIGSILNIVIVFIVYSIIYKIVDYFDSRLRKDLSGF